MLTIKRLYLLRHAKSSWDDPDLSDHDRPLAGRGRRAAKAIGAYLREHDIEPDLVLCSSALRARETLERLELGAAAVQIEPELYAAGASALLARLRRVPDAVGSVMLVGHNPGLQDLALDLARPAPDVDELRVKYPTAALLTLILEDWEALARGTADLAGFVRPRDLT